MRTTEVGECRATVTLCGMSGVTENIENESNYQ